MSVSWQNLLLIGVLCGKLCRARETQAFSWGQFTDDLKMHLRQFLDLSFNLTTIFV